MKFGRRRRAAQESGQPTPGMYAQPVAPWLLGRGVSDTETQTQPMPTIADVRKALWRTVASSMEGPRSTSSSEIRPGTNEYLIHLMRCLDRREELGHQVVGVDDLMSDAAREQVRTRQTLETSGRYMEPDVYRSALLSNVPDEELEVTRMAVNGCVAEMLNTPYAEPFPRDDLHEPQFREKD